MMNALLKQIEKNHKERRRWLALVLCLSIMVSFETFAALRLKGETRTYTKQVLECPFAEEGAEPVAHTHNDDCYDEDGNLVCTLPEREEHTHTEDCYVETRVPVCKLEETPGHLHTDECYTEETKIGCGQEEDEGQQHTEECGHVERELTCDRDELQVHIHNADCFRTVELNVEEFEEQQESLEEDPEVESELTGEPEPTEEPESAEEREPAEEFEQMEEPEPTEEQDPTRETEPTEDQEPSEEEALPEEQEPEEESEPEEEPEEKGEPKPTGEQELTKEPETTEEQEPVEGQEAFEEPDESQETELTEEQEPEEEPEPSEEQDLNEEQELNEGQEVLEEPEQSEKSESTEEQKEDTVLPEEIKDDETTEEEEDSEAVEDESAVPMPAQCFEKSAGGVKVTVEAPNGALPENTRMSVEPLNGNMFRSTVADVIEGDVLEVQAVDISFYTAEGTEVEPAIPIRVIITPASSQHENKDTQVVHVDDSGVASMVVQTEDENAGKRDVVFDTERFSIYCVVFSTEVYYKSFTGETFKITLDYDKDSGIPNGAELRVSEILPEVEEYEDYYAQAVQAVAGGETLLENAYARFFDIEIWAEGEKIEPTGTVTVSVKLEDTPTETDALPTVVHFAESGTQIIEPEICSDENDTEFIRFTTDGFSVFSVVFSVDFYWKIDGNHYNYSLPGGGFVSFETLVETLGIADQTAEEETAFEKGRTDDAVNMNSMRISEATKDFVSNVERVEFSNPSLVWVGKVDEETTVGKLKEANELEIRYSAVLTEEQIEEINRQTVEAGDWVLISIIPFDTEESMTVTMKDGELFTIMVTDAQIQKDYITVKRGTSVAQEILEVEKQWKNSAGESVVPATNSTVSVQLMRYKSNAIRKRVTVELQQFDGTNVIRTKTLNITDGKIRTVVKYSQHMPSVEDIQISSSTNAFLDIDRTELDNNRVQLIIKNLNLTDGMTITMRPSSNERISQDSSVESIDNSFNGQYGELTGSVIALNQENSWHYQWVIDNDTSIGENVIPRTDDRGNSYYYYVIEEPVNNYLTSYSVNEAVLSGKLVITNYGEGNSINKYNIKLQIVDSTTLNRPLGSSKFALYRSETENGTYSIVTSIENLALDSNNWFAVPEEGVEIGGLTTGYYKITEETPPAGYIITDRTPVLFRISEDGVIENNSAADVIYSETEREFRVPNTPGVELPMTGGIGTSLYTVLGGILTATAGAVLTLRARKRES